MRKLHQDELDGSLLSLHYVPVDQAALWDRNPKKHDMPGLKRSIKEHGFRDPPSYDAALKGFVEGNGRTVAVLELSQDGGEPPRGIAVEKATGAWCIPVLFGVDARSRAAAESYAVDHNNLVMAGSGLSAVEVATVWREGGYMAVLEDLRKSDIAPISVDDEALDHLRSEFYDLDNDSGSDGSLLSHTDVTIDDPENEVELGDIWHLGDHVLICCGVFDDWPLWIDHLRQGGGPSDDVGEQKEVLFVPFPGPFVPLSMKADKHRLVMVQPDKYICGHILDQWENVRGIDDMERLE